MFCSAHLLKVKSLRQKEWKIRLRNINCDTRRRVNNTHLKKVNQ